MPSNFNFTVKLIVIHKVLQTNLDFYRTIKLFFSNLQIINVYVKKLLMFLYCCFLDFQTWNSVLVINFLWSHDEFRHIFCVIQMYVTSRVVAEFKSYWMFRGETYPKYRWQKKLKIKTLKKKNTLDSFGD